MKAFFKEFKGEFKKIIWPSRNALIKATTTVIVVSILVGIFIAAIDVLLGSGVNLLSNIF